MSALASRFSVNGDCRCYAGEAVTVELAFDDGAGGTIDLSGRSFAFTIYRTTDREQLVSVAGDILTDGDGHFVRFVIDGEQTESLWGADRLRLAHEVAELTGSGRDIWIAGKFAVDRSPGNVTPAAGDSAAPSTRFLFDQRFPRRTIISAKGAPGFSAAQLAFDAGLIPEATAEALADYIGGAATYAHTEGDYAHNQGDYAKAQGDSVDGTVGSAIADALTTIGQAQDTAVGATEAGATLAAASAEVAAEIVAFVAAVLISMGRYYATRAAGVAAIPSGELFTSNEGGALIVYQRTATTPFYTALTQVGYSGDVGASLLTAAAGVLLGRSTAGNGAIEQLTLAGLLRLSGGVLTGLHGVHAPFPVASGDYVQPVINAGGLNTIAAVANQVYFVPFRPCRDVTIDRLECEVVGGLAAAAMSLGIYSDSGGVPTSLLVSSAAPVDASTAAIKNAAVSLTMSRGTTYWFACLCSDAFNVRAAALPAMAHMGSAAGSMFSLTFKTSAQAFGALPASPGAIALGAAANFAPLVRARIA